MRRMISASAAFCLALGVGTWALAQETKTHTEITTKHSGPGVDTKTKSETVTGTVKKYEPGKKIEISGPKDKTYSFDLDENARVDGTIAVGERARVKYTKDKDGKEHVTVVSVGSKRMVGEATMSRSHTESTTKHEAPGMSTTKEKTESVIGIVKEYEAGKKIVVTGPKDKDYKFDLDEGATVKGPVAVGDRVKVTYQKGDSGEKVKVVSHYRRKA